MYVASNDRTFAPIVAAACKNNKQIQVKQFSGPIRCNSYWDDGSRTEFTLVDIVTRRSVTLPAGHPAYDRRPDGSPAGNVELRELPVNTCLVCHGVFMGKPSTVRVLLRPDNLAECLPVHVAAISESAVKALGAIRGMKGGHYRQEAFDRYGLGKYSVDNPFIVELLAAGLVKANRAGSITVTLDGTNYQHNLTS